MYVKLSKMNLCQLKLKKCALTEESNDCSDGIFKLLELQSEFNKYLSLCGDLRV